MPPTRRHYTCQPGMRYCMRCERERPIQDFAEVKRGGRTYRRHLCHEHWNQYQREQKDRHRSAINERRRATYRADPERGRSKSQTEYQRLRRRVLDAYGGACECCGERTYEFLAIDHIDGGGNQHRKSGGGSSGVIRWLARNGCPEGYRVLCHNCNSALGYYGYCPHAQVRLQPAVRG